MPYGAVNPKARDHCMRDDEPAAIHSGTLVPPHNTAQNGPMHVDLISPDCVDPAPAPSAGQRWLGEG